MCSFISIFKLPNPFFDFSLLHFFITVFQVSIMRLVFVDRSTSRKSWRDKNKRFFSYSSERKSVWKLFIFLGMDFMIFLELSSLIQVIEISFFKVIHPEKISADSEMEKRAENLCSSPKNLSMSESVSEAISVNSVVNG